MDVLDELVAQSARRAATLPERVGERSRRPSFAAAIAGRERISVIAEFKRCSPSQGPIAPDADVAATVTRYRDGGASALSVLTEPTRFQGRDLDVQMAAAAVELPILNKDFTVSPRQLEHAVHLGASAALLIVRCLSELQLCELAATCRSLGLTPLVECHDEREIPAALAIDDAVIGINQRNLARMTIDQGHGRRLLGGIPADRIVVVESGIEDPAGIRALEGAADAVLVGTALMRAADPVEFLRAALAADEAGDARGGAA